MPQDSARRRTVLATESSRCSRRHIHISSPSDPWPPNSPDLNPVDYRICCWMKDRVYNLYGGPEVPTFVQTPHRRHNRTYNHTTDSLI